MENCLPRRLLNPCGLSPFAMLLPPTCGVPEGIEVLLIDPAYADGGTLVIHTDIPTGPRKDAFDDEDAMHIPENSKNLHTLLGPWNSARLPYTRQSDFGTAYLELA